METVKAMGNKPPVYMDIRRDNATRALCQLRPGVRIMGLTMGQFSLLDMIAAALDKTGPAHVMLSTWTAGIRDVRLASVMLDVGRIKSLRLLVDRSFPTRQAAYCAALVRCFGNDAIRTTRTHAKIALIFNDEWSVSIRSSMNLNRNPRVENFDLDDDPDILAFFKAHFDELGEEMEPGFVPTRDVDAVFDRLRRGINPFAVAGERERAAAGLPSDPAELAEWARGRLSSPRDVRALAKKMKVKVDAVRAALRGDDLTLLEDLTWALV